MRRLVLFVLGSVGPCAVAVLAALTLLCCAVSAQQVDPYADSYRQQQREHLKQRRDLLLDHARYLYFAAGCKVLVGPNAIGVTVIILDEAKAISGGIVGQQFADEIRAAEREGLAKASEPGACDYWHQHPEEVYRVRNATQAAFQNLIQ